MKDEKHLAQELGVPLAELHDVAANAKSLYVYRTWKKGEKTRKLRVPKGRLRTIQKAIHTKILNRLWLPSTMHGWRKRHSPKTYVRPHIHRRAVLNADIQDFFPSVTGGQVCAFLEREGYSPSAARLLTALVICDNQLPQGSPTSQAIGNQILRRLDRRLARLAELHGLRYSNYADEVSISGGKRVRKIKNLVHKIIEQEQFKVNPAKTKLLPRHERQEVSGIALNRKPSRGRAEYRTLRAIIHNCLKVGPHTQNKANHPNFKTHLQGRISYFRHVNSRLGERLWRQFHRIDWGQAATTPG